MIAPDFALTQANQYLHIFVAINFQTPNAWLIIDCSQRPCFSTPRSRTSEQQVQRRLGGVEREREKIFFSRSLDSAFPPPWNRLFALLSRSIAILCARPSTPTKK